MADEVMNIARGKTGWYSMLTAASDAITIVVLMVVEADDTLNNYDELGALIGAAGNTEANSTNYARKELTDITVSQDDTANTAKAVVDADKTWSAVALAAAESWVELLMCWDGDTGAGADTDIIPLTHHDFAVTPNGGDITANFDQSLGFWASS